jgi:hypothetical protein
MITSPLFLRTRDSESTEKLRIICTGLAAYQRFRSFTAKQTHPRRICVPWPALGGCIILLVTLTGLFWLAPPTLHWAFPSQTEVLPVAAAKTRSRRRRTTLPETSPPLRFEDT